MSYRSRSIARPVFEVYNGTFVILVNQLWDHWMDPCIGCIYIYICMWYILHRSLLELGISVSGNSSRFIKDMLMIVTSPQVDVQVETGRSAGLI